MTYILEVEICQKSDSTLSKEDIQKMVKEYIDKCNIFEIDKVQRTNIQWNNNMNDHVISLLYSCPNISVKEILKEKCSSIIMYVYRLIEDEAAIETMLWDSEELSVASHWILPCREFDELWETLHYDTNVKNNLLKLIETSINFSNKNVDFNIISWNRVVLLHGPPGTGKTSLCKALAQKAAIRFGEKFKRGELIEINSHSLFSKWFSESGKLVMKLFSEIKTLLEDSQTFVCILIDEVESLAHARNSSMNGTEPSDSIRVVNTLLTQLDQIKNYKNVLVLTTSNITNAVDMAFVDRVDIKQYIGLPTQKAIMLIYISCLEELIKTGFIEHHTDKVMPLDITIHKDIHELCSISAGLSGRALRKIPFLTQAMHVNTKNPCNLSEFIEAMKSTVVEYRGNEIEEYKKNHR